MNVLRKRTSIYLVIVVTLFSLLLSCGSTPSDTATADREATGDSREDGEAKAKTAEVASDAETLAWNESLLTKKNTETDSLKLPFWEEQNHLRTHTDSLLGISKIKIDDSQLKVNAEAPHVVMDLSFENKGEKPMELKQWLVSLEAVNNETIEARVLEEDLSQTLQPGEVVKLKKDLYIEDPGFSRFTSAGGEASKGIYLQNVITFETGGEGGSTFLITKHRID